MSPEEQMLQMAALDPNIALKLSTFTRKWYIDARITINEGSFLTGIAEHRDTTDEAIRAAFDQLRGIADDHRIVASPCGHRRHYRWNGATFAELPLPEAAKA